MDTKNIVRKLKIGESDEFEINAVLLNGLTVDQIKESISFDDIQTGNETLLFNCGTSTDTGV